MYRPPARRSIRDGALFSPVKDRPLRIALGAEASQGLDEGLKGGGKSKSRIKHFFDIFGE